MGAGSTVPRQWQGYLENHPNDVPGMWRKRAKQWIRKQRREKKIKRKQKEKRKEKRKQKKDAEIEEEERKIMNEDNWVETT